MYWVLMDALALYCVLGGWFLVFVPCACLALALFLLLVEMLARVSFFSGFWVLREVWAYISLPFVDCWVVGEVPILFCCGVGARRQYLLFCSWVL